MVVGAMLNCSEDWLSPALLDMTRRVTLASAKARAKINLTLDVLGKRGDGYHELRSLVVSVDLFDRVSCRLRPEPGVGIACNDSALNGPDNLAYRAAVKLAGRTGLDPSLEINLEKHIPIAAGLGGGSSDAAATLHLCNELWRTELDSRKLAEIGAELGSDVPLFFSLPAALVRGRGEHVEPVRMRWAGWVLLAFVDARVSTEEVYNAWRQGDGEWSPGERSDRVLQATSAEEISPLLSNHLEPAVFRVSPAVQNAYEVLQRTGLGPMRVSGAGSTLYRLFDDKEGACRAARKIDDMPMGLRTSVVAAPAGPGFAISEEY